MKIWKIYRKLYNFQYFITLLLFFIATNCFLHKRDNIFKIHFVYMCVVPKLYLCGLHIPAVTFG